MPLPHGGYCRPDHRLSADRQTGRYNCIALLSQGYLRWPIDKSGANTAALAMLNAGKPDKEAITVRQSKYLNNLVEQDHRNIKPRIRPIQGSKSFRRAQTLLAGIELVQIIRKGQYHHPAGDHLSPADQFYLCSGQLMYGPFWVALVTLSGCRFILLPYLAMDMPGAARRWAA